MSNLFKKANVSYLVASFLATLTLISSLVLAVTSNVPLPLILALAVLSVLVIVLSCKAIRNNREVGANRDKSAKKEQELENKIILEKGARKDVDRQVERLSNQLNKLTQEKRGLESKIERLNGEIGQLKIQLESEEELYNKLEERGGGKNEELEKKITKEIEYLKSCLNMTSKNDDLHKQNEKHPSENSNVDRALLDKFLEAEKNHSKNINKLEETINILERNSLQGNAVQDKTSRTEEDPGYVSRCSIPISRLYNTMVTHQTDVHKTKIRSN